MRNYGYTAVRLDLDRNIVDRLPNTFTTAKECFTAARIAFGKFGGLQFVASKAVMK